MDCMPPQQFTFTNIMGQGRVNQLGGVFINGRPLPQQIRLKIIEMANSGVKPCHISRQLRVSHGCVSKILYRYAETGSVTPGQIGGSPRSKKMIETVEKQICELKMNNPAASPNEVRHLLIRNGVCSRSTAPTVTTISRVLRSVQCKQKPSATNLKHSIDDILKSETQSSPGSSLDGENGSEPVITESRRNRTSFTSEQLSTLEAAFNSNTYPDATQREQIAKATGLSEPKIQVWFSNRRARYRKSYTTAALNPFVAPTPTVSPFLLIQKDLLPSPMAPLYPSIFPPNFLLPSHPHEDEKP
ncbi:hypothetical protein QR680_001100 [Steinernema hermaphroditum]|uniref:Paired domain-containing protein n=1 Tax=Steinernema hermaphroditum TaxID=289476 RepID=A0AA39LFF7_9BILA|nr:hypothetical protein QR680_001100 [Steinernema hermaphroditum]